MRSESSILKNEKEAASVAALKFIRDGMTLGIGSGSTIAVFIKLLGQKVRAGELHVEGVATSLISERLAIEVGIPMIQPRRSLFLDLNIDGADEIGPRLALIKGGGGALLREKIVASVSREFLVIADSSKVVKKLGRFPLPIEVIPFATPWIMDRIQSLGAEPVLRVSKNDPNMLAVTDQGNWLIDCHFREIPDPDQLASTLESIPGIVEHGLFLRMASGALVAIGNQVSYLNSEGTFLNAESWPV